MVIWGLLILILIVLIYKMPLRFNVNYYYDGNLNNLDIVFETFYGLVKHNIDISSLKVKLASKSDKRKSTVRKSKGLSYLSNLWIDEFILIVKFDCYDAAITGIIAGILYFIESNVLLLSLKCKRVENYKFIIQPLFKQENMVDIKFSCIFQFKLGQIIYEKIKLFLLKI